MRHLLNTIWIENIKPGNNKLKIVAVDISSIAPHK